MKLRAAMVSIAATVSVLALAFTPIAGAQHDSAGASERDRTYADVPADHPHFDGIYAVSDAGVATGYADGRFGPDDRLTRGQLATLLATAAHLETAQDPPFADVSPAHAHAHGIAAAAEWELIRGYQDGSYRPQQFTSRAQIATVVANAYNLEAVSPPPFDDVAVDHAHAQGIAAVAEHGVAAGYADGTFRPAEPVTRGQMATLLAHADPQL